MFRRESAVQATAGHGGCSRVFLSPRQTARPGARIGLLARERFGKNTQGFKFAGYGVQLISGGQVLDSKFSADDLAAYVGASRNTPGKKMGDGNKGAGSKKK